MEDQSKEQQNQPDSKPQTQKYENKAQTQAELHSLTSKYNSLSEKHSKLVKEHKEVLAQNRDQMLKLKTLEEELSIQQTTNVRLNKQLELSEANLAKFKLQTKRNQDLLVKRIRKTEQLLDYIASDVLVFCRYQKDQLLKKFRDSFVNLIEQKSFLGKSGKFEKFRIKMDGKLEKLVEFVKEEMTKSTKATDKKEKLGKNVFKSLKTCSKNLQGLDIFNPLITAKSGPEAEELKKLTFVKVKEEYEKALESMKSQNITIASPFTPRKGRETMQSLDTSAILDTSSHYMPTTPRGERTDRTTGTHTPLDNSLILYQNLNNSIRVQQENSQILGLELEDSNLYLQELK